MTNQEFLEGISLEGEEWRDVVGYEGLYAVSNLGRIATCARTFIRKGGNPYTLQPKLLKLSKCDNITGHLAVSLYKDGHKPRKYVHRLVAEAFIPNPNNHPIIEHINCIPTDNRVENLRWCTQSENMNNPITKETIHNRIRRNFISPNRKAVVQIANGKMVAIYNFVTDTDNHGYNSASVRKCCRGTLATYRGFQWMYLSDYETSYQ